MKYKHNNFLQAQTRFVDALLDDAGDNRFEVKIGKLDKKYNFASLK
jgi:hypothetical protein